MQKNKKLCSKCYSGNMIMVHIPNVQTYFMSKSFLDRKFILIPRLKTYSLLRNGRVIQGKFSPKKVLEYSVNLINGVGALNTIYYMCDKCSNAYMKMHVVD